MADDADAPRRGGGKREAHVVLASLLHERVKLDLSTTHLCFLAGLHLRAEASALVSFSDEQLVAYYEQSCSLAETHVENWKKRATHAIQQLCEQRLLTRVDGNGLVRAGDYALTKLAVAVVEFFIGDEALTRESLTLLTATLRAQLVEVLASSRKCTADEQWRTSVIGPLRVTVMDLIQGIDARQRGLDAQQSELQDEIARLLDAQWSDAIDQCQSLLDTMTTTLQELNEILLQETSSLHALLQDIRTLANDTGQIEVVSCVQRVMEHVDRLGAWGSSKQHAWSEYYQRVHRYLRDVVRLDPERAVSQRLRDAISRWPTKPYYLLVASAPSMLSLRPLDVRVERAPVKRERVDREAPLDIVVSDDLRKRIEERVRDLIAAGGTDLTAITREVLALVRVEQRFQLAGEAADLVARIARTASPRERAWRHVVDRLEIEDWEVRGPKETR